MPSTTCLSPLSWQGKAVLLVSGYPFCVSFSTKEQIHVYFTSFSFFHEMVCNRDFFALWLFLKLIMYPRKQSILVHWNPLLIFSAYSCIDNHNLFNHSPVFRHFYCFQYFAKTNNAIINNPTQVYFCFIGGVSSR